MKDFFISYNYRDKIWAKNIYSWLVEAGYSCIMQDSDFGPGSNFVLEMDKASKAAKRTIALLSPNYFTSNYTPSEWAVAYANDPTGENQLLIPIKIQECNIDGLLAQILHINLIGLTIHEMKGELLSGINSLQDNGTYSPRTIPDKKSNSVPTPKSTHFEINGDGNIQAGRDIVYTEKKTIKREIKPTSIHITEKQSYKIREKVLEIGSLLEKAGDDNSYRNTWGSLYGVFKVTSYKTIPRRKYGAVMKWLRQQKAQTRPRLRRTDNDEWRKLTYESIWSQANYMNLSKIEVYEIAKKRLNLKTSISSLTELGEQKLDKLYKIFQRLK